MTLTDAEWSVMEILLGGERFSLGEVAAPLTERNGWNKKTTQTYLTRMEAKGIVRVERGTPRPYSARLTRDECAKQERRRLLNAYRGAAGELIAAFLKESSLSREEAERLRGLLDEMEADE